MAAENFDLDVIDLDDGPLLDDKEPLISDGNGNVSLLADGNNNDSNLEKSSRCFSCEGDEMFRLTISHKIRSCLSVGSCAKAAFQCFPFIRTMMRYNWKKNIVPDIVAGLTVGIMNIPQGMAYSLLAELEPVIGLYTSFFAPLLYFIFGTSLQMSLGTFALASLMLADPVTRLAGDKVDEHLLQGFNVSLDAGNRSHHEIMANLRWEVALSVSLLVGLMQIGMGLLRLGFLAVFLSDALVSGFTTGAAFHVFTSQLPAVFGIKIARHTGAYRLIKTYASLIMALSHTNLITLSVSVVSMVILILVRIFVNPVVMRKIKFPIPVELLLVITGTIVSYFLSLHRDWSVQIIGKIPSGFPTPRVPRFYIMSQVALDAVTIAFFMFTCTVSLGKIFSRKHRYTLDANQEAFAMGFTNTIIPFFGAFFSAGSLSRSMVQDEMGGKSQMAGLISSLLILVVLLAIGPLFSSVPNCILSCIILISLKGLFKQFTELPKLWRSSKYDFAIWLITFACTLLLDIGLGLLAGIAFSLLTVVARAHSLSVKLVSDIPHEMEARTSQNSQPIRIVPGIRVIRLDGPLYFGSAEKLRSHTLSMSKLTSRSRTGSINLPFSAAGDNEITRRIILDCRLVTFVDSTGLRIMEELAEDLDPIGVELTIVDSEKQLFKPLTSSRSDNITVSLSLEDMLRMAGRHYGMNNTDGREEIQSQEGRTQNIQSLDGSATCIGNDGSNNFGHTNQDDFDIIT